MLMNDLLVNPATTWSRGYIVNTPAACCIGVQLFVELRPEKCRGPGKC